MSRRIAELEQKDVISTARIAELERSLASSNDSLALLQADVEKHKLRSKNLLHELEKEKSLRATAGERCTEMTALIDSLQRKNGEQEEEIKNLQKQAQSLRSRNESADGKFMDMRIARDQLRVQIDSLRETIKRLDLRVKHLTHDYKTSTLTVAHLKAEKDSLMKKLLDVEEKSGSWKLEGTASRCLYRQDLGLGGKAGVYQRTTVCDEKYHSDADSTISALHISNSKLESTVARQDVEINAGAAKEKQLKKQLHACCTLVDDGAIAVKRLTEHILQMNGGFDQLLEAYQAPPQVLRSLQGKNAMEDDFVDDLYGGDVAFEDDFAYAGILAGDDVVTDMLENDATKRMMRLKEMFLLLTGM